MGWVRIDDLESVEVWPQPGVTRDALTTGTDELIVDQQFDDPCVSG